MILAIDQGTTGTHCLVFDEQRRADRLGAYREFAQHFPQPGWVEHDAAEIWQVTQAVAGEALDDAGLRDRASSRRSASPTSARRSACGIRRAASRCTTRSSGRTGARPSAASELRAQGHEAARARAHRASCSTRTSRRPRSQWLLENVDGLRERAENGRAVFGTVDSWLLFKLTGEHVTDASNASRTLLYDIARGRWDAELLELFGVPERALPRVSGERRAVRRDARRGAARPRRADRGRRRRSAGRAVRSGVRRSGAWARTRTARARSCCSTPAFSRRPRRAGCSRRSRGGRAVARLRARGVDLRDRRRRAVAARRAWRDRARRGDRGARAQRSRTTTACTSCRR